MQRKSKHLYPNLKSIAWREKLEYLAKTRILANLASQEDKLNTKHQLVLTGRIQTLNIINGGLRVWSVSAKQHWK